MNTKNRKPARWDLYDKKRWCSTREACEFYHISGPALTYRLARSSKKVTFRLIRRGKGLMKIYDIGELGEAMADFIVHKHNLDGLVPARYGNRVKTFDNVRVDVMHRPRGNRSALESLGYGEFDVCYD